MPNADVAMTLDDCVDEVLGMLTGQDLSYEPQFDRYRAVTRQLNRALRANALEREWSFYASTEDVGTAAAGQQEVALRSTVRPRIIGDDSVRLSNEVGTPLVWAAILPRDALSKYAGREGLWVSVTRQSLRFSRPFHDAEAGLRIQVPVMREPKMFRLPDTAETEVPAETRAQLLDFDYPDAIITRAAYYVAQSDPIMQPRAQTLEQEWKNIFYALNERDDRHTDSPYLNEWTVPIQSDIHAGSSWDTHHPHADERY